MSQRRPPARAHALVIGGAALFFIAVWAFRWLSMGAVENDHFVALARAYQLLHGDWPVRDFADPGQPLTYLLSATAAWLFGPTLRTDVIVAITLLSLAASLTYLLAVRASGSVFIAAAAVAVEVAAAPRLYNAGKLLIPLASVALGWRYADSPSIPRLIALAAWTAVACLWRHDFIVSMAIPTIVLLAVCHERRPAVRLAALYLAVTLAFLLPWFIYVQWAGGVVTYIGAALRFAATEAQRTVTWPGNARVTLAATLAIPMIAIVLARRPYEGLSFAHIVFAAVTTLIVNVVLLRDVITTRLPDVIALTVVLAAWIAGRVVPTRVLQASAVVTLVMVVTLVGWRLGSQGYGFPTPEKVARQFAAVSTMLQAEAPEVIPNRERLPLIRYLSSCTPATSRVLVAGFAPEIPVLARRPFAGGLSSWIPGYYTAPRDVERAAAQLGRETVSMAVMLEGSASFVEEWPRLAADLRARGLVERVWRLDGTDVVVWISEELAARAPSAPPACGV
jgi:hypothetical protein